MSIEEKVKVDETDIFLSYYNLSLSPFKAKKSYKNLTQGVYQSLDLKPEQTEESGNNELIKALTNGICSYFINTMLTNQPPVKLVTTNLHEYDYYLVRSLCLTQAEQYLRNVSSVLDVFDYEAEDSDDNEAPLLPLNILIGLKLPTLGLLLNNVSFNTYQNKDTEIYRMVGSCKCEPVGLDDKTNYVCIQL